MQRFRMLLLNRVAESLSFENYLKVKPESDNMLDLSCIITKEKENMFCAWCPEMEIASDGRTIEEAKNNQKEAIELYIEDEDAVVPKNGHESMMTTELI